MGPTHASHPMSGDENPSNFPGASQSQNVEETPADYLLRLLYVRLQNHIAQVENGVCRD